MDDPLTTAAPPAQPAPAPVAASPAPMVDPKEAEAEAAGRKARLGDRDASPPVMPASESSCPHASGTYRAAWMRGWSDEEAKARRAERAA